MLPIELTLLHDLPVAQDRDRMRRPVGPPNPAPQVLAYFLDDNAFLPEETAAKSNDWWFWVKGNAKAEIVLRAPVASLGDNNWVTKAITRLTLEVRNGGAAESRDRRHGQRIADIRHDARRVESRDARGSSRRAVPPRDSADELSLQHVGRRRQPGSCRFSKCRARRRASARAAIRGSSAR